MASQERLNEELRAWVRANATRGGPRIARRAPPEINLSADVLKRLAALPSTPNVAYAADDDL